MTIADLLEELRDRDPSLEVVLSVEDAEGEPFDTPATGAYVSLGRLFISGCGDE